ncbi:MAG: hypothetical protein ACREXK_08690 [Gammaproteobacteria bacterium]
MKKPLLFAAVLCGTLAAAPAMAAQDVSADFHALSAMSSPVPAMTATQMSEVEGAGLLCLGPVLKLVLGLLTCVTCH